MSPTRRSPRRTHPAAAVAAATVAVLIALAVLPAGPAGAGGASWWLERDGYRPGELVDARSGVSWAHNPNLGQPDEAPYRAYLVRLTEGSLDDRRSLAEKAAAGTYVGDVQIVFESIPVGLPGTRAGPNGAILRFVLPDLEPGWYSIVHCGTPCRTYLGDLMGGTLTVLNPDRSYPPNPLATTTVPAPVELPTTSTPLPTLATTSTSAATSSTSTTSTPAPSPEPDGGPGRAAAAPAIGGSDTPGNGPGGAGVLAVTAILGVAGAAAWAGRRRRRRSGVSLEPRPG